MNLDAQNDLARKIAAEIEAHNPSRRGHGERVSSYSVATGHAMGLRDSELRNLRYAALLHDIWKLEFPSDLLERPEPLDEGELNALRKGPTVFVARHSMGLEDISFAIEHLYAKWDGSGMPRISGEDICFASRIIGVCAAFAVMTSDQPWRAAISDESAIEELQNRSSTQFAPVAVTAFLEIQPLIQPVTNVF